MKADFTICNLDNYKIKIVGLSKLNEEYLPESVEEGLEKYYSNNLFKYSQTYTLNIILYNSVKQDEIIIDELYNLHDSEDDITFFNFDYDGYYVIYHVIIPTVDWYNSLDDKRFLNNKNIFLTDGNSVYEVINGQLKQISSNIFTTNTDNSIVSKGVKKTFSIYYLRDCYINISKKILELPITSCSKHYKNNDLIFKRDFINMSLNIIKYHVEYNMLYEALNILETINRCGGICPNKKLNLLLNIENDGCSDCGYIKTESY